MSQISKTGIFVAVAAVLAMVAVFVVPGERMPAVFQDQGQPFFKAFSPLAVGSVEVTGYDEERAQPKPFKVEYSGGRWIIPSAEGYIADVKDRVARMTALFADLKKGDLRTDRDADFASLGVIDPRDESNTSSKGRGQRVTLKDQSGAVLADLIIGKPVEGNFRYYYVREPSSKRVYTCQIDASAISTRFADWVETDVLKLGSAQVRHLTFDNYKLRLERRGDSMQPNLIPGDAVTVDRAADGAWSLASLPAGHELDKEKLDSAQSTLSSLTLVGVRRKPAGAMEAIRKMEEAIAKSQKTGQGPSEELAMELERHFAGMMRCGYYPVLGAGGKIRLLSNEGEIRVACDDGVVYTLRMGNVVMGDPDELAGAATTQPAKGGQAPTTQPGREHRYLFVTVDFDPKLLGPKPTPPTTRPTTQPQAATQPTTLPTDPAQVEYQDKLKEYEKKLADGQKRRDELAKKFDEWYYVVSADAYAKLKLDRDTIVKKIPTTQPTTMPAVTPPAPAMLGLPQR